MKRPQVQVQDNMKYLKTAAAMADAGDVRVLVESMWKGEAIEDLKEDPMQKVSERTIAMPCNNSQYIGDQALTRQDK